MAPAVLNVTVGLFAGVVLVEYTTLLMPVVVYGVVDALVEAIVLEVAEVIVLTVV